jgi:hypothetical protein
VKPNSDPGRRQAAIAVLPFTDRSFDDPGGSGRVTVFVKTLPMFLPLVVERRGLLGFA